MYTVIQVTVTLTNFETSSPVTPPSSLQVPHSRLLILFYDLLSLSRAIFVTMDFEPASAENW